MNEEHNKPLKALNIYTKRCVYICYYFKVLIKFVCGTLCLKIMHATKRK